MSKNGIDRTECWRCGYQRPTFESCPKCGGSCKPRTKQKQQKEDRSACDMEGCLKPREEETAEGFMCEMHTRKLHGIDTDIDQ